jgi:hypothetical protein
MRRGGRSPVLPPARWTGKVGERWELPDCATAASGLNALKRLEKASFEPLFRVRSTNYGSGGWEFESLRARQ